VRFCEVPHYTRTYAVELTSAGDGGRFTYSADCGPNDNLVQFARATDLLLIEATLTEPEPDEERGHMTAAEAAELGRRAGARKLVLTHFSDELDPDRMRAQAEESFEGPVELASEGAVYTV
jgi:ribonuclease BN (tRNA processing enzyme)